MNDDGAQPWESLALDVNGDGRLTIGDVWAWLEHLLFMPGDAALSLLLTYAPTLAEFFELSPDNYGSPFSKFVSIGVWLLVLILSGITYNAIRNFDRAFTAYISGRYDELTRVLRIMRRKVTSWVGLMQHRYRTKSPSVIVADVELEELEAAVLRCHASVDDFQVLTASEVSAALKLPLRQVQSALRKLSEFRLVERGFGTDEGHEGHHITQAGQIYLIEH